MNRVQLIALVVCALVSLAIAAPAPEQIKSDELAQYAELLEQQRELEELLRGKMSPQETAVDESSQPMMDKRAQTFVRFGKRAQTFVRFGKRAQTFVRFGRSAPQEEQM